VELARTVFNMFHSNTFQQVDEQLINEFWRELLCNSFGLVIQILELLKKMSSSGGWKKKASKSSPHDIPPSRKKKASPVDRKPLNLVFSQDSSPSMSPPSSHHTKRKISNTSDDGIKSSSSKRNTRESTVISLDDSSDDDFKFESDRKKKKVQKPSPRKSKVIDDDEEDQPKTSNDDDFDDFDLDDETISSILDDMEELSSSSTTKNNIPIDVDSEDEAATEEDTSTLDWYEKYAPTDPDDLLVNAKTVQRFEDWLCRSPTENSFQHTCVVAGSGGSGKRSMVYLMIHKHFGFGNVHIYHPQKMLKKSEVAEPSYARDVNSEDSNVGWLYNKDETDLLNAFLSEKDLTRSRQLSQRYHEHGGFDSMPKGPSASQVIEDFKSFLRSCIMKRTLTFSNQSVDTDVAFIHKLLHVSTREKKKKTTLPDHHVTLLVIEELPPATTKQQKEKLFECLNGIHSLLEKYSQGKRLIKMIVIHDHSGSSTPEYDVMVHFPREFMDRSALIKVNKFSMTSMTKQLTRICKLEKVHRFVDATDYKEIAEGADGDMRHAINQMQFFATTLGKKAPKKLQKKKTIELPKMKQNKKPKEVISKTNNSTRDCQTTIHHVVARILYGKRINGRVEFDLESDVLNLYQNSNSKASSEQTITNYVQTNAPHFCTDISALSQSLDTFSHCDATFGKKYFNNKHEVTQQTTTFNQYQFLTTSQSVLYHHQTHVSKPDKLKQVLAPQVMKCLYQTREEQVKQLLFLFQQSDVDNTLLKKAAYGTFPYDLIGLLSDVTGRETFETTVPMLVEMQKSRRGLGPWRTMHNYPKNREKALVGGSSDAIETMDVVLNQAAKFATDLNQSVLSLVFTHLFGYGRDDVSLYVPPKEDDIED